MRVTGHVPVMVHRVLDHLDPHPGAGPQGRGGVYVDGTVGGGGHAEAILDRSSPDGKLVGVDRDPSAIDAARGRLARFGDRVDLVHGDFAELPVILADRSPGGADGMLFDLGVSSSQLDDPARGFSLRSAGPLDMRMDQADPVRAADVLDAIDERDLAHALRRFGGERMAGRVARAVLERRRAGRLETTADLREAVHAALRRSRAGRIDAATRTFQALRILTNREMESLERLLGCFAELLRPGGRAVFITFHSEEDRRVKHALRMLARAGGRAPGPGPRVAIRTPHAERPTPQEVAANPRARSARLRAVERLGGGATS